MASLIRAVGKDERDERKSIEGGSSDGIEKYVALEGALASLSLKKGGCCCLS